MYTREITASIILIILLSIIFFAPPLIFKITIFIIVGLAFYELFFLIKKPYWPSITFFIFLLIFLFFASIFEENRILFLYAIMISALNDSGAYYVGKKYGNKKIFPLTSPKKTLEGFMAGIIISSSTLYLVAYFKIIKFDLIFSFISGSTFYLILIACSLMAVFGDFIESRIKRIANVKDSGSLLPGHGGMLDRIDSHVVVIPAFFILLGVIT